MLRSLRPGAIVALMLMLATLAAISCGDSEPIPDIDATATIIESKAQAMAKTMMDATVQATPTITPISPTPPIAPAPLTATFIKENFGFSIGLP